ncbi:MAG: cytochrome-c peroxidase [Planctomycetes bacterium]|jgi:cytochrome c peroxidase|nr:cytochrome-c peroxidase [Planctomycetota bacterium]
MYFLALLSNVLFAVIAFDDDKVEFTPQQIALILEHSPLPEVPPDPTNRVYESEAAARLGQALFFDRRLSGNGEISCATCHEPQKSWTDGKKMASAVSNLSRNSMTLWNVAYNRWFFWDGRKDTLWSQALGPLEDSREHAGSRLQYAHLMVDDPDYRRAYAEVFGELPDLSSSVRFPRNGRPMPGQADHPHALNWTSMTFADRDTVNGIFANIGKAIAAFERKLISRSSPFDAFVEGLREGDSRKLQAISPAAQRGLALFVGKGRCFLCHTGPNFTDREFHNDRIPGTEGEGILDPGRFRGVEQVRADEFNGIGRYSDQTSGDAHAKVAFLIRNSHSLGEFKTPTLRNAALTAPYMHNGEFATLADVIRFYSKLEGALPMHKGAERLLIPIHLTAKEEQDLVSFLESLTDDRLAPELLKPPVKPYLEK